MSISQDLIFALCFKMVSVRDHEIHFLKDACLKATSSETKPMLTVLGMRKPLRECWVGSNKDIISSK